MAYVLTTTTSSVNEGSSVTVTLYTAGLTNGTLIPYVITGTGIDVGDFLIPGQFTGNFRITNNVGTITLDLKADLKTEFSETLTLTLPNTGNYETINIVVNDTSRTSSTTVVQFYISSPSLIVSEGQIATFDIRAINLAAGTVVPYTILGISQADLTGASETTGVVTFSASSVPNETIASVSLSITEDFVTEGPESIILLLNPDFPYTFEISSTITIQDTSVYVAPIYNITADKNTVIEGESVTFTLTTYNVPAGSIVPWMLVPSIGDITLSDFSNVNALTGYFPPTVTVGNANVSSFIVTTRDDFIFERAESFYITSPGNSAGSQLVKIIDSGNTLITTDNIFSGNVSIKFLDKAILNANVGSITSNKGFWDGTTGLLSEDMVLQGKLPYGNEDTLAFYHPFSYVIRSTKSIEEWRDSIKTLLHPAGLTIFSEINNETLPNSVISLSPKSADETTVNVIDIVSVNNNISSSSNSFTVDSVTF